jgi:hypothetical protein
LTKLVAVIDARVDSERARFDEVDRIAVPQVHLHDPPSAGQGIGPPPVSPSRGDDSDPMVDRCVGV